MAIPRLKTELENYLVYGVDPKHRRIYFGLPVDIGFEDQGGFDQCSVELAIRAIKRMQDDHPSKPIELHMNSYGGEVYSMLYLVDVILSSTCQFKFYGGGSIMSAATWVMAVCDERYLYPSAHIMVHDGSDYFQEKHTDGQIDAAHANSLQNKLNKIYVENSFMPLKFWEDICKRDLYLTAEETIQLGLADFMVPYTKRGNLRKKRQHAMSKPPEKKTMEILITKLYKRIKTNTPSTELKIQMPKEALEDPSVVLDETPIETSDGSKE